MESRQDQIFNPARVEELYKALVLDGQIQEDQDGKQIRKIARATYDFDVDGGAISNIDIGGEIPVNAIITRAYLQVSETLTSATDAAVVGIRVNGASPVAIVTGIAINDVSNPWDAGLQEGIQDGTMANADAVAETGQIQVTIATEAVTAGKFVAFLEYVVGS